MEFKIYNGNVFEFECESTKCYGILVDYKSTNEKILDTVIVDVITNFQETLEEKDYIKERKAFSRPFPDGVKGIVDVSRNLEKKPGLI